MPRTTLMNNLIHGPVGPLPEGVAGAAPVFGDPLFASPPSVFSLMAGSPALGQGLGVDWILTDYFGRPMRQPPDLGAIQYVAPNNPPVLIPAGNRSVRADETIRIEIQAQDADADPLDLSATGELVFERQHSLMDELQLDCANRTQQPLVGISGSSRSQSHLDSSSLRA